MNTLPDAYMDTYSEMVDLVDEIMGLTGEQSLFPTQKMAIADILFRRTEDLAASYGVKKTSLPPSVDDPPRHPRDTYDMVPLQLIMGGRK